MEHLATNEKAVKVPTKPLSPIPEAGASSRVPTLNKPLLCQILPKLIDNI